MFIKVTSVHLVVSNKFNITNVELERKGTWVST